jgi:hypothetical protein
MARVAWELGVNQEQGQCMLCKQGIEDIEHVLLSCPAYGQHREKLLTSVARSYSRGNNGANILDEGEDRLIEVLLGANAGCKLTEDEVDRATKRFLRKAWYARRAVTSAINQEFGRMDVQWMAREPGWYRPNPTSPSKASPERFRQTKKKGSFPYMPGLCGEVEIAGPVPEQPGTEQQQEGKGGVGRKGVRRRLMLV